MLIGIAVMSFRTEGQTIPQLIQTGSACDTVDARYMWARLNEYRRQQNLQPLAMSLQLCEAAEIQALDLAARPSFQVGNVRSRNSAEGELFLDDWLDAVAYGRYGGTELVAAASPYVIADLAPRPGGNNVDFVTYIMGRLNEEHLYTNALNSVYREIGIAYYETSNRHVYVFIFGAQPGVFPIIPVAPDYQPGGDEPYEYAYRWNRSTSIGLLFLNERFAPSGYSRNTIGTVTHIRLARDEEDRAACPVPGQVLDNGWTNMPLTEVRPYPFELVDERGIQTIYFQMCDAANNTVFNSLVMEYPGAATTVDTSSTEADDLDAVALSSTEIAQVERQNAVFAVQTQDSVYATQNSAGLFATEYGVTQTQDVLNAQNQAVISTLAVLDPESTEDSDLVARLIQTSSAINALRMENEAIIADVTATRAVATAVPTLTLAPTTIPATPLPTFTPVTTLPFPGLNLYWGDETGMFIVYNPNNTSVSFDVLSRITFRADMDGETVVYSLAQAVDRARNARSVTALIARGCMMVQDLQDGVDVSLADVQAYRGECSGWNFLSAEDAILASDVFWRGVDFEVYYNGIIVKSCPATGSGVFECIIQAQIQTDATSNADIISVNTNPTAVPTNTPRPDTVPPLNIRLAWNRAQGMFIIINTSGETIPLIDIQPLSFISLDTGFEYGMVGLVNMASTQGVTDFAAGRCMLIQDLDDGIVANASTVAAYRGECNISLGLTASDGIGTSEVFWLGSGFDVRYNGILVRTCLTEDVFECDLP